MLVIRPSQTEAFQQSSLDRFAADLVEHLKSHFSGQAAALGDEPKLTAFVRRTIRKAAEYEIDNKGGVTTLAELMIQFGEDFERSPLRTWTINVLTQRTLPGQVRADALRERYQELTGGRPVLAS